MLRHLHVRNLALIEEASLEFEGGLTVFTGETGAGKSILLDALVLLSGERANTSVVRTGESSATVEAFFEYRPHGPVAVWLNENGLASGDSFDLIMRREVQITGRNRCWINGSLAPLSQLADLASLLYEMHGQNQHILLLEASAQRDYFDAFSGLQREREKVRKLYHDLIEAEKEHEVLRAKETERDKQLDYVRFQIEELCDLGLSPGELSNLAAEKKRLAHVEELKDKGAMVCRALVESSDDEQSAADILGFTQAALSSMAGLDPQLLQVSDSLQEAAERIRDVGNELCRYMENLEGDPQRLAWIEDREDAIRRALRKHGSTEEDALRRLQELQSEKESLENLANEQSDVKSRIIGLREELLKSAESLSGKRRTAVKQFLHPLTSILKEFAIPKVRVDIEFRPVSRGVVLDPSGNSKMCGPDGLEDVEILFSANPGEPLQPLRKVASGGELSRVMLALRSLEAAKADLFTLVFDEVDAGISGHAASRIADRLSLLGERHQVIYVTHQAALAVVAHRHYIVEKFVEKARTRTVIACADGNTRRMEISRLLDGGKRTGASLVLADEMLRNEK